MTELVLPPGMLVRELLEDHLGMIVAHENIANIYVMWTPTMKIQKESWFNLIEVWSEEDVLGGA